MSPQPVDALAASGSVVSRVLVAAVLGIFRAMPAFAQEAFALFVGDLAWWLRIRRRVVLDNLAQAFPERSAEARRAIARGAYRTMARAVLEAISSDRLSDEELESAVSVADWKGLDQLLAQRQPVLIASAHVGSWELFAEIMARRGIAFAAVVRPLAGAFNAWLVESRQRAGVELIVQRGALHGMLKALKRGLAVVQLIDQALPAKEAVFVPFFGRLAATTPALSMAALRSKAPVYVVLATREVTGLSMVVEGPFPVPDTGDRRADLTAHTRELTACIERVIRQRPEQWLWLHRRWKVAPPSTRGSEENTHPEASPAKQSAAD